ncbi:hypothetical protein LMG23992_04334 [Cupriavidus laharis]|uniref:Novel STAND NTPase 1 domain-containing protein n=1 Tax=Cupriavidus laharis TaxID=151654 RepID=A0ABM8XL02_9BURK|nr:hypothetical protein [Cupriavidus laharis]CAG9180893.1 hypothetical protein LMG23992_04334 [Cupriavidus laharis]
MAHASPGPYIGPTPLDETDPIFGRDAEIEELRDRLIADRIVLLYSPSGAGKTSLIEAGLRPRLADRFDVLPTARVSAPYGGANRYVTSVLHCWATRTGVKPRADDTLLSCLSRLQNQATGARPRRLMIVLDQFEEIFTLDNDDTAQKREFFTQLGDVLEHGASPVWALVSMREEYFSWLDAYRDLVPTRLTNTMRIDLLTREQALQALIGPAAAVGVDFREDAAQRLVHDLAQIRTRNANGQAVMREGRFVEPVQLQVVGLSLWRQCFGDAGTPPAGAAITLDQVQQLDTGAALASYCNLALDAAAPTRARQRVVREWIESRLITAANMRAQATLDAGVRASPTAAELGVLQQYHLVRAQSRQDAQWYELTHDRLTEPLRASNAQWRAQYLPHWKQLARAWALSGENPGVFGKLTSTEELDDTLLEPEDMHSEAENRFLAAYRRNRESRARARKWRILGYALGLVTLFFLIGFVLSAWQLRSTKQDLARQNALFSLLNSRPAPDAALLAAVEGTRGQHGHDRPGNAFDFRRPLLGTLHRARHIEAYLARADGRMTEVQADATHRVTARLEAGRWTVEITELAPGGRSARLDETQLRNQHPQGVRAFALAGAGTLATGGQDGSVALWSIAQPGRATRLALPRGARPESGWGPVSALASDGRRLVAGFEGGRVVMWDLARAGGNWQQPVATGRAHAMRVTGLALFDNGRQLATVSRDGKARLWRLPENSAPGPALLAGPAQELPSPPGNADWFSGYHSVAVSPDSSLVVAGTRGGRIDVWRAADGGRWPRPLSGHDDAVARLVFTNARQLLSGGWDGRVIKWQLDPEGMQVVRHELIDLPAQITGLAPGGHQQLLASTEQGELLQMRVDTPRNPVARIVARKQDGAPPQLLALGGSSPSQAAASDSQGLTMLQAEGAQPAVRRLPGQFQAPVAALAWARGAQRLALADAGGNVWIVGTDGTGRLLPEARAGTQARLALSAGADLLAIRSGEAGSGRRLQIWRIPAAGKADAAPPCQVPLPDDLARATNAVFRPGSSELAVSDDDRLSLWRIETSGPDCASARATPVLQFQDLPRGQITSLAFSHQGDALVAGNYLGKVFRLALGQAPSDPARTAGAPVLLKQDASGVITSLAVPDAPFVVAGDDHGNLFLLDSHADRPLPIPQALYHDPRQPVAQLSVSDDGRWLYAAGTEVAAVWDLDLDAWRRQACAIVGGGFTARQKADYFKADTPQPDACETR